MARHGFAWLVLGLILLLGPSPEVGAGFHADHWVATDALGRALPSYEDVGPVREDKLVGVFYYIWNGTHGNRVYDISEIIKQPPESRQWGPSPAFHFWGEPEYGYYRSEDPWVLRRDLQMLSNAKVDFLYFDVTNAVPYLNVVRALCEVSRQMRAEGIQTPEITFTTNTGSGRTMNLLYDEFYSNNEYSELWFRWNGKPFILGDINDPELRSDVRDFFTIRRSWVGSFNSSQMENHWPWLNWTPQSWGWSGHSENREQVAVSIAFHPQNPRGQSWTTATGQPPVDQSYNTEFTGQGLHAQEQWERALEVDPQVIMVSQWNEWLAQRFIWDRGDGQYGGRPISDGDSWFVDVYSQEFNRDMAPMKGGHTDSMYYQLVSNIRRYKGMEPPLTFSQPKAISISGNFSQWNDVHPRFWDPEGDVMDRNHSGYDTRVTLVNTTGRNDIIESRVTHDSEYVYFYVKTAEPLTHYSGADWMLLFIDADGNKETGWEGYDYLVNNSVQDGQTTTISRWQNGSWVAFATIGYRVEGTNLNLEIPRGLINQYDDRVHFHFKWADNIQGVGDIENFFLYGDVAPDRRFNYVYDNTGMPYGGEIDAIGFDFDNGTMQGWSLTSTDGQGRQYFAVVPPGENSPNEDPHSGSHFIGLHVPAFSLNEPFYTQDQPHGTLVLRSPEFTLNGGGDLNAWLSGGGAGSPSLAGTSVSALPSTSVDGGFLGIALRNVTTGTYVLSATKTTGGNEWQQVGFSAAQLSALPQDHVYTLDLIDAGHGGWGWVNMDSVTIPGTIPGTTPAPTLTRYIQINGGEWLQQGSATLCAGGTVSLSPHPMEENWQWSGPNGFSANSREVTLSNITTAQAGNYVATYTANGSSDSVTYSVNVHALPQASVGITNASEDQNNGTISLTFPDTAGRSNISFSINDGQTYTMVADNSGSYTFSNLAPGDYAVWSRWGNGECPVKLGDYQLIRDASDFEGDVTYDFDDGTFQGWTDLTPANSNSGPRNWGPSPPAFPGGTHSGAGAIGQHIEGGGIQDSSHPTLWLRSPEFVLDGSGALRVWLFGGAGSGSLTGVPVGSIPAQSSEPGFQGVALRNANTETFVLSGSKNSSGDDWEQIVFTASELAALDQNAVYTLDLIDAGHGGWGWVAMDSVTIPGEISGEEPPPPPPSAPTISSISGQTILVNTSTGTLSFTVGSEEVAPGTLTLTGSSSNATLAPNGNIVFGGSGAERTVAVTPSADQTGSSTITVTVSDGVRTASTAFVVTVVSEALPVDFDFAAGTLSGWTEAGSDGQERQFFAVVPPSVSSPNITPHSGDYFIGLHIPAFDLDAGYTQDSEHDTLILSSPEFTLNGSGDLTVWLAGGGSAGVSLAGTNVASLLTASSTDGFLGVALRNVTTGTYVLSASKSSGGNEWEQVTFTAGQLAALPQEDGYTLDLIDARHGGWGWVNMDSVTIPGAQATIAERPRLAIQPWGTDGVRLSWSAAAGEWTLERSTEVDGGYTDAGLDVMVEGDENAAYDTIVSPKQFYRLIE